MKKSIIYKKILTLIVSSTIGSSLVGCVSTQEKYKELVPIIYELPDDEKNCLKAYQTLIQQRGLDIDKCKIISVNESYIIIGELTFIDYKVKEKDNIDELIVRYDMDKEKFMRINNLESYNLTPNMPLIIYYYNRYNISQAFNDYQIYQINQNDTLSNISANYHIDLEDIISENAFITDPNYIEQGTYIKIPSKKMQK